MYNPKEHSLFYREPNLLVQLRPCVIVFAGLPLSGKTTIGSALADCSNGIYLDIDDIRKRIVGNTERRADKEELWLMRAAYETKFERAREIVNYGYPVILGATFSRDTYREGLDWLTKSTNVPTKVFMFSSSEEETSKRLKERQKNGSSSVVTDPTIYNLIRERYNPTVAVDYTIKTDGRIENTLQEILFHLEEFKV